MKSNQSNLIWCALVLFAATLSGCTTLSASNNISVHGDSLVLVGTEPNELMYDSILPGTVVVRNKYAQDQQGLIVYEEGRDYVVDYKAGTIARTAHSSMPDFSTNILYGKKEFNHTEHPGYGNLPFFVFVDYTSTNPYNLISPTRYSYQLSKTKSILDNGGTLNVIGFGDSITAGGEATKLELRFQQRYINHLHSLYPNATIKLENGATGGDATPQGLKRLNDKVLSQDPDLVLVGFGMNDHNVRGVTPEQFEDNLINITKKIQDKTGAEILLFSAFPPNPNWKFGSHRMELYSTATQRAAQRTNSAFADVYSIWMKVLERKDLPSLLGNNINHPNDFGHWLYLEGLKSVNF